jgi:hypothetical protein
VRLGLERTHLRPLLIRLYDWERALPAASLSGACVPPRSAQDSARAHPRSILMPEINSKQCFLLSPATTTATGRREPGEHSNAPLRRVSEQHAPLFNFIVVCDEINLHRQLESYAETTIVLSKPFIESDSLRNASR